MQKSQQLVQCRYTEIQLELENTSVTVYRHLLSALQEFWYERFQFSGRRTLDVQMMSSEGGGREEIKCTRSNHTRVKWLLRPSQSSSNSHLHADGHSACTDTWSSFLTALKPDIHALGFTGNFSKPNLLSHGSETSITRIRAIPVTGRGCLQVCEMLRNTNCVDNELIDGGKLSALRTGCALLPRNIIYSASSSRLC
jgi:hypothetical protein